MTSSSTTPTIPEDIIACIIDQVSDTTTLRSCSTVSRAFVSHSQRRLFSFSDVRLTPRIFSHLRNSPHIAKHIRIISIVDKAWPPSQNLEGQSWLLDQPLAPSVFRMLSESNVRSLSWENEGGLESGWVAFGGDLGSSVPLLLSSSSLTTMVLTRLTIGMTTFIASPQLTDLSLYSCSFVLSPELVGSQYSVKPQLRRLEMDDVTSEIPLVTLAALFDLSRLIDLTLPSTGGKIFALIEHCSESLERLGLNALKNSENLTKFKLDTTPHLRYVKILLNTYGRNAVLSSWLPLVLEDLASKPSYSNKLEQLAIHLPRDPWNLRAGNMGPDFWYADVNWCRLDVTLVDKAFSNLREVSFVSETCDTQEDTTGGTLASDCLARWIRVMEQRLPRSHAKGILVVYCACTYSFIERRQRRRAELRALLRSLKVPRPVPSEDE